MSIGRSPKARAVSVGSPAGTPKVGEREFKRRTKAQATRRAKRTRTARLRRPARSTSIGEALRRVPRTAWVCAVVAFANAVCWSILVPPFQVPDEPSHFAYAQQLAENGGLPTSDGSSYSPEEEVALRDLHQYEVRQSPEVHAISTDAEQRQLQEDLGQHPSRQGNGAVGGSYADPPLYFALETIPYVLASAGSLLDQLEAMRVASAAMAGLAALFVFLFLREALPRARWAWTAGGLSVALAPLLGFVSGAVNPGSMLVAVSAASFYAIARGFRRGLTRRLAIAIGAAAAIGVLTSLNFIGLLPGILFGTAVLAIRASPVNRRIAYDHLGVALAIPAFPLAIYVLVNLLSGHPVLGIVSSTLKLHTAGGSLLGKISYVWQLYLPRLPGMANHFPGVSPIRELWFNRGVGYYGWFDTSFPNWVDNVALVVAAALTALLARELVAERSALRRRALEGAVYVVMGAGLLILIGVTSYINTASEGVFAEPRYLLPLIPLLGLALALAARGVGPRWGPAVGASIVVLFLGHDVFSQLLVVARYYG